MTTMDQKPKTRPSIPRKMTFPDISFIQTSPKSSGKKFLLKHLYGETLTRNQAGRE